MFRASRLASSLNATTSGRSSRGAYTTLAMVDHAVVYHEDFKINPIPEGHRFPMPKDALLYARLRELGWANRTFTPRPPDIDIDTLCLAHGRAYVEGFLNGTLTPAEMRPIGLQWSPELVRRTLIGTGAAILAGRLALQYGAACMTNGGTHHAHRDRGSGWCIFNDQAVAARALQRDVGISRILFCDLDVHQGDGTASIFEGDASVFTLSLHCAEQSFPLQYMKSSRDVHVPSGTEDAEYLRILASHLPAVLDDFRPEIVFYNAGCDVHASDSLGKLKLTTEGILARDRFVFTECLARGVPVAAAIGGGYHPDHHALVDRHVQLHRACREVLAEIGWKRNAVVAGAGTARTRV